MRLRSAGVASKGTRSLSCRLMPQAPNSESLRTLCTGLRSGRTKSPKGSRPRLPTVQRPKLNLSSLRGAYWSLAASFVRVIVCHPLLCMFVNRVVARYENACISIRILSLSRQYVQIYLYFCGDGQGHPHKSMLLILEESSRPVQR